MSCTNCCFDDARRPVAPCPGNTDEAAQLLHGACADCPMAMSYLRNLPPELQAELRALPRVQACRAEPAPTLPTRRPRAA